MDKDKRHKILIVEDEPHVRESCKHMIERRWPVDVITTPNGEEGIEIVRKQQPVLILLDIMIEGSKNGWEVLKEIRTFDDQVKVIIVTGVPVVTPEETQAIKHHALAGVIGKPIDTNTLFAKIKEILDEQGIYLKLVVDPKYDRSIKGSPAARAIVHSILNRHTAIRARCERISRDIEDGLMDEEFKQNMTNEFLFLCKFVLAELDSAKPIIEDIRKL